MAGSGGGGGYRLTKREVDQLRAEAQERLERSRQDAEINSYLQDTLVRINDRDTELVRERLDGVEAAVAERVDEFDRVLFGGSVAKHTYVDGLSDIDALVVMSESPSEDPAEVRDELARVLRERLHMGDVADIRVGRLAVTVTYVDGMEVQLLPAIHHADDIQISSADGERWTQINPREFADRLSALNDRQGHAVVPAIKLAKAIAAKSLPEKARPTGYHLEALALSAFRTYEGPRTPQAMVAHFFEQAAQDVLRPIRDVTGQSRYVDDALGDSGSADRRRLARSLGAIARRVSGAKGVADWRSLLEE